MADKHNIPRCKMLSNCKLLSDHIVWKITQRNNMRRANACDPALKLLNEEITSDIHKHKQNIWKEHLNAHWDHRHNTPILWKIIQCLPNSARPHFHNIKQLHNNHTKTYCTVKHPTHKTNRCIYRAKHKMQAYNITLTTTQV